MPTVMVQSRFVDGKLLPNMSIRFSLNIFEATFLRDIWIWVYVFCWVFVTEL